VGTPSVLAAWRQLFGRLSLSPACRRFPSKNAPAKPEIDVDKEAEFWPEGV
jgi:hypothetical protein